MPGAGHTACTVEMVSMQRRVDVAVIDEIQMIGDETRCAACWGSTHTHKIYSPLHARRAQSHSSFGPAADQLAAGQP